MQAALLIIGDEILSGETKDTNSSFAAALLTQNNIPLAHTLVVSDKKESIHAGMDFLLPRADLIITSGGLGPTNDDLTIESLAEYFNSPLTFSEEVYANIKDRFAKLGRTPTDNNKRQAIVPEIAQVYTNPKGTAPALWIEHEGKIIITLPGVPTEMRFLLENIFLSKLTHRFGGNPIIHKTIHTVGIPESTLAEKLKEVEDAITEANNNECYFKLAYLPSLGMVKLRIIACGPEAQNVEEQVEGFRESIEAKVKNYIFGYDQDQFASYIGQLLRERNATLSTAESCTGGYLAHQITTVTGSADYYMGSIISYDNEVKIRQLGVKKETLNQYGAVSEETAKEMLEGVLEVFGTDYGIVTTGIAGPTGDVEGKPIGTVYIGVGSKYKQVIKRYQFNRDRLENIHLFAITSLDMLRKLILGIPLEEK